MCAMVPMFRVRASGNSRIGSPDEPRALICSAACAIPLPSHTMTTGLPRPSELLMGRLPAVMGERAVRLGHTVEVLSLLHGRAGPLERVQELGRQLVGHAFAFAVTRYAD